MATENRVREKFSFLLNLRNELDFNLADEIHELKKHRQFTATIRDGIRLVVDLRRGRVDVLLELFPWVSDHFAPPSASAEFEQMMRRLIEQGSPKQPLLIADDDTPVNGLRPLIAASALGDDEIVLDIRDVQGGDSTQNFLNSVMGISGVPNG